MQEQHLGTEAHRRVERAMDNMERVLVGKRDVIRLLMTAVLAGGHCLIEDVPGVGKTRLAKACAITCGCTFQRIQFTPDLLPSDITGVSVFHAQSQAFVFRPGPIFGQVILADEVNRTAPRTQSALLEAMEEGTVTVDGVEHALPKPFFVLATQNPLEFEATFPLPEAQLDRFLMRIRIGYPSFDDEVSLLGSNGSASIANVVSPVLNAEQLLECQTLVKRVHVDEKLKSYIVQLVHATREHPSLRLGASPRAGLGLYGAAQSMAWIGGRDFVIPDDILELVPAVLGHRIVLNAEGRFRGESVDDALNGIVQAIPVPGMSIPSSRRP